MAFLHVHAHGSSIDSLVRIIKHEGNAEVRLVHNYKPTIHFVAILAVLAKMKFVFAANVCLLFRGHISLCSKFGIVQVGSEIQEIFIAWTTAKFLHPHINPLFLAQVLILRRLALRLR